jgi:outer membrane protein assembly factor BamA
VHPLDRFHLGGQNSVRGFATDSLGPVSSRSNAGVDVLGGDVFASMAVSVSVPFPRFALSNALGARSVSWIISYFLDIAPAGVATL